MGIHNDDAIMLQFTMLRGLRFIWYANATFNTIMHLNTLIHRETSQDVEFKYFSEIFSQQQQNKVARFNTKPPSKQIANLREIYCTIISVIELHLKIVYVCIIIIWYIRKWTFRNLNCSNSIIVAKMKIDYVILYSHFYVFISNHCISEQMLAFLQ